MRYLERQKPAATWIRNPLLPDARSVIVCAINYNTARPLTSYDGMRAWISRYAWGEDYHEVLQKKLETLAQWIQEQSPTRTRTYVDTGPLLERVFAKYAGIGWFGKNTCIINERTGSWLFLGCIITDVEFGYDAPVPDRCGTCTRCIDACPTGAILEPYVLDSRKCISYTTIELRGEIQEDARHRNWPSPLRLRYLPGRLSLESARAAVERSGLSAQTGSFLAGTRTSVRSDRRRVAFTDSWYSNEACKSEGPA